MAKPSKSRIFSSGIPAASPELRVFRIPRIPEIRPSADLVDSVTSSAGLSAHMLAAALHQCSPKACGVINSQPFGRPWRLGLTNVAIGASGLPVLLDLRGTRDRDG